MMNRLVAFLTVALLAGPLISLLPGASGPGGGGPAVRPPEYALRDGVAAQPPARPAPAPVVDSARFRAPGEDELYRRAAEVAWAYVEREYQPATGLVNSVLNYPYATVWDIGSGLAALYSAGELGLIDRAEYDRRMSRALRTLGSLRLFDNAAFNKNYQVAQGRTAGRNDRESVGRADGYGWSATDLGRLLVWLGIIAKNQPQHAQAAEAVVRRIDFDRVIRDGYLWGESTTRGGAVRAYQEGRIGYEQYAAAGFSLWGKNADLALRLAENAKQVEVLGVPLFDDRRGDSRLTGEPFFLMGLELGWWDPEWQKQAERVLDAQEARFQQTKRLTMVSEDALPDPPVYFYYYTLYHDQEPFAVLSLTSRLRGTPPRWVSTKAAFAWHAVMPRPYTWRVLETVSDRAAHRSLGWSSGIYERSGAATGSQNINTAAVVLESALYHKRRRPLVAGAGG